MLNTSLKKHLLIILLFSYAALLLTSTTCMADVGDWTWMSGANKRNQSGVYGEKEIPDPDNAPGARYSSISWTDSAGDLWLFGGYGYDSDSSDYLNDLWSYDPDTNQWTWMSGDNETNQRAVYGEKGTPNPGNVPGARYSSISWTDSGDALWLFGGYGYDSDSQGILNDLWRYDPDTNQWAWMSGDNEINQRAVYGEKGTPDPDNVPGARYLSISWTDSAGALWLFGGNDYDNDSPGYRNDLWRYDPDTNQWTWMSGDNETNQRAVYGEKGTPDPDNVPGARYLSISWTDSAGALWLFGGYGYDNDSRGFLNDLWRYEPDTNQWAWMSGDNETNQYGIYGEKGTPDPDNVPGARYSSISWTDRADNLWLLGGKGYAASNNADRLNDLWRYEPDINQWTWMNGDNETNQYGIYGEKDTPDPDNVPGSRFGSISWTDSAGALWLFGGDCYASTNFGFLNDLWHYETFACYGNDDCDNGVFCDGAEICLDGKCFPGLYPCPGEFCNETKEICLECLEDNDCFGGVCVNNVCFDCRANTDCDNGLYCDGEETCAANICIEGTYPCGANYCNETATSCQECTGDEDCFGGVCVDDICFDCRADTDCDNGLYCDGTETCTAGACESINIPCASKFCDETADTCQECTEDEDCFSGVCVDDVCFDCRADTDCDNGLYCDGAETCKVGLCETNNIPCASKFCDETAGTCQECTGDDDCFGGMCIKNLCAECADNTDCDNSLYCDGTEACAAGVCILGATPCAGDFCNEDDDTCQECIDDNDCFGWFCVDSLCMECAFDDDCGNDLFCDGIEACDAGACVSAGSPCDGDTPICEERYDECVECLIDYDCAAAYKCESTFCVQRCELIIKYKAPLSEKLIKKDKKLNLSITGGELFDPTGDVDAAGLQVLKTKLNTKKGRLKLKLLVPQGSEPQTIPIQVGDCLGEIEIY